MSGNLKLSLLLVQALTLSHAMPSSNTHNLKREMAQVFVVETRSSESPYEIKVKAFDQEIQLNLRKPDSTVFTDGFTFGTRSVYRKELNEIEENIYVDILKKAALHVVSHPTNGHQVNGIMNGMSIGHENGVHFVTKHKAQRGEGHPNWCGTNSTAPDSYGHDHDYTPIRTGAGPATIEIQAVLDKEMSDLLGSAENITRYLGLMFHASNNVFNELVSPSVSLKLAGVYQLSDSDSSALTGGLTDGGDAMDTVIGNLRNYVQSPHEGLGPNDIVSLFTGRGNEVGTVGIAYLGGACGRSDVLIVQDPGAFWVGTDPFTHEVGHSLGATHDFENSCGEHGYIMGYAPGTPNYFHWSSCSKNEIQRKANSRSGSCYYTDDAGSEVQQGTSDPGDESVMTFQYQCEKQVRAYYHDDSLQVRYRTSENPPEKACSKKMICVVGSSGIGVSVAAEGTSCNLSGGRCHKGLCV